MVAVQAIFTKASTTVDGGWRISFDVSESEAKAVTDIAQLKNEALYLVVMTEAEFHASERVKTREKRESGGSNR